MMSILLLALLQPDPEQIELARQGLGPYALAFMVISMSAVTLLTVWCFWRILGGRQHFDPDGTGPAHSPVPGEVERSARKPPR
jgi:hypothetical protein